MLKCKHLCDIVFVAAKKGVTDMKENGLLEGAGAYLKLPGSEIKFSQKQFKQTLYSNKEFYNQFVSVCYSSLTNDILKRESKKNMEEQYGAGMASPYQAILQQLNNNSD
jgi:hypothetical protein